MKGILTIYITLFFSIAGAAQQMVGSDAYFLNLLSINPAYAGSENCFSTSFMYRTQWAGTEGAPTTYQFSAHAPVFQNKMGLGLSAVNDNIGISSTSHFMANYAYRLPLSQGMLTLGLAAGISIYSTNWNGVTATDYDDPLLSDFPSTTVLPNTSVGARYSFKKFDFGFSAPFMLNHRPDSITNQQTLTHRFSEYAYHLYASTGFNLSPNLSFHPSVLFQYQMDNPVGFNISAQLSYNELVWAGFSYRTEKALMYHIQLQVNNQLRVVYTFTSYLGETSSYFNQSHEVILRYNLIQLVNAVNPLNF